MEYYGTKMRLIFDMALKPILRGLQQLLLRSGMIAHNINCCGFLIFRGYCHIVIFSSVFKSVAPDGTVGLYTYIF